MTIETQAILIELLQRISVSLNEHNVLLKKQNELIAILPNDQNKLIAKQNELILESIDTGKRLLAVHILNAKVNAKTAVLLNAMSVLDHKEFIELINQV